MQNTKWSKQALRSLLKSESVWTSLQMRDQLCNDKFDEDHKFKREPCIKQNKFEEMNVPSEFYHNGQFNWQVPLSPNLGIFRVNWIYITNKIWTSKMCRHYIHVFGTIPLQFARNLKCGTFYVSCSFGPRAGVHSSVWTKIPTSWHATLCVLPFLHPFFPVV